MDRPRVALVLGAGGIVGQAYHAGVLAALENDLGWDPRAADLIVGSSAGSVTAALLRLGVPASDLAAWAVKAPPSVRGSSVIGYLEGNREELTRPELHDWLRPWRVPSAALLARLARRPWGVRPLAALMTLVPPGRIDITQPAELLDDIAPAGWPQGLWICAVRLSDGRRVVFGRPGSPVVALSRAVAASCAIPGYFAPVRAGDDSYLDGGAHSPTNADVLRKEDFDLVLAISPMSAAGGRARSVDAPLRWLNHRRLERELRVVKARGTPVVRFAPGPASLSAMGINPMTETRSARIILESFIETGTHVASHPARDRLVPLTAQAPHERAF
jgi:NTE family protein